MVCFGPGPVLLNVKMETVATALPARSGLASGNRPTFTKKEVMKKKLLMS